MKAAGVPVVVVGQLGYEISHSCLSCLDQRCPGLLGQQTGLAPAFAAADLIHGFVADGALHLAFLLFSPNIVCRQEHNEQSVSVSNLYLSVILRKWMHAHLVA